MKCLSWIRKGNMDRFEFVLISKHGCWLNIAKIGVNLLTGQCLDRRIGMVSQLLGVVSIWPKFKNNKNAKVNWQYIADDARINLFLLYSTL